MTQKQMLIGMSLGNGYGSQATAWTAPQVNPNNYADMDAQVRYAQKAERGKFQFLFFPDFPNLATTDNQESPTITLDPFLTMAAISRHTHKIGMASTASTQWNEPYNLARQLKTLDVMSGGRIGWNAVTGSDPRGAANYGVEMQSSSDRYGRAHEVIQIVQALWGSWGEDAWVKDQEKGIFADWSKVAPINLQGRYVGSAGPLPIPPSPQGQPVIFQAGGSPNGLAVAGRYANVVIGATFTIEDSIAQRRAVRQAAQDAGRNPDDIKFIAGLMPTIAPTVREALDRRGSFVEPKIRQRASYLAMMLGIATLPDSLDEPIDPAALAHTRPNLGDPRSAKALEIAREGWSVRDILYHGIIDYHPSPIGPAQVTADHMTEWFEAGAADGFWLSPDVYEDGIDDFVDGVVPILQERGIFHTDYEGNTLRDHLGAPYQYGLSKDLQ